MSVLRAVLVASALFSTCCHSAPSPRAGATVLDEVPLIDGHNDLPANFRSLLSNQINDFNFDRDLTQDPVWNCTTCYTDLPRLRTGKVGAQFWVAFVSCDGQYKDAVEQTLEQIDVIKRFINQYPDDLQFADSAAGIEEAFAAGKIGSLIAVEGGHSIDSRLGALRLYQQLGVRYLTLTHSCNTPWADSSTADDTAPEHDGLTDYGRTVVRELNRLGIMVDLSHVSYQTMVDAIQESSAPVIFSHSSAWAVCNNSRNVRDDVLQMVTENGGIVMVNFYSVYVTCSDVDRGTIDDVVAHINHIRTVAGVDHVGIGSDYDGVTSVPVGLDDVSHYPDLFDRLANSTADEPQWTDEDLRKLAGENLLRVMRAVEQVRDSLAGEETIEDLLPESDIPEEAEACRTDNI